MDCEANRVRELPETEELVCLDVEQLATSVPQAGKSIGLGRSASYEAAKRGDIPTVRIGGRIFVPLRKFRRMFG
jgi:hypothetical protein